MPTQLTTAHSTRAGGPSPDRTPERRLKERPPSRFRSIARAGRLDGPTTRGPGSYQVLLTTAFRSRQGQALAGPLNLRWSAGSHLTRPISIQLRTTPSLVYDHGTTGRQHPATPFVMILCPPTSPCRLNRGDRPTTRPARPQG